MHAEPSEAFTALCRVPSARLDLTRAVLQLAAERAPAGEIDIDSPLTVLAAIAEAARPGVEAAESTFARVEALNRALYAEAGFHGNQQDYTDPRNSFLDEVVVRRTGIPITLAVVWVDVARRLGLEASGIGFPGHFLVRVDEVKSGRAPLATHETVGILVDPFFGRILTLEECAERLKVALGPDVPFDQRFLRAATTHEILVRMLNNLKSSYLRQGDGLAALGCFDRILLLVPDAASEYRDRGLLYEGLDCVAPALQDYETYLRLAPDAPDAVKLRRRIRALEQKRPRLN